MIDEDALRERAADGLGWAVTHAGGNGERGQRTREHRRFLAEQERPRVAVEERSGGPERHWWEEARCRGRDLAIFFPPESGKSKARRDRGPYAAAWVVCQRCPVRAECLEAAMEEEGRWGAGARFGMRGGMTPNERAELATERQAAKLRARGSA